jgi:hypothetical protein
MNEMVEDEKYVDVLDGSSGCPYIEFGARVCYKEKVPPT